MVTDGPTSRRAISLAVAPTGLGEVNTPIEMDVGGIFTRIEVADINVDGSPELDVYGFDGKSQTLLAWSANKKKSLSSITLTDLDAAQSKGYRGGDEFAFVACLDAVMPARFTRAGVVEIHLSPHLPLAKWVRFLPICGGEQFFDSFGDRDALSALSRFMRFHRHDWW